MDAYQNSYMGLPGVSPEELNFIKQATANLNEDQQKYFYTVYSTKRKNPQDILIFCVIGFLIPGLQRFIVGQMGMGIAYLCTGGLFIIGSIIDLVNYKTLALEYNRKMAFEAYQMADISR